MPKARTSSVIFWRNPGSKAVRGAIALAMGVMAALTAAGPVQAEMLRIRTWGDYLSPQVVKRFERETGVTVQMEEINSYTEMVAPLLDGANRADVIFPADFQVRELVEKGLLEKIESDRLANFWNVDDVWRSRAFDLRNEYTVPHVWGTTAFVVDTAVYGGAMDSLRVVFQPPRALASRMAFVDSGFDMVQLALVWLKLPRCSSEGEDMTKVRDLLLPLLRRVPVVRSERLARDLGVGRYAMAVIWNGAAFLARKSRSSLRYANPSEGALVWTDVMVVPKGAANKANALAFLSFMMRPEIAAMESNYNGYANMIRGAEAFMDPALLNAPEIITPPNSALDFFAYCGGGVEARQEAVWRALKAEAGVLDQPKD